MKKSIKIDLSDAKEGMVLAEDVIDAKGVRLVTIGTELSGTSINVLKKRSIESITIIQHEELSEEERKNKIHEIEQTLELAFSKSQNEPFMQDLKQIILDYRIREL